MKCINSYHDLLEKVGEGDLVPHLPRSVMENEEEVRSATNPLYEVLTNGNGSFDFVFKHGAPVEAVSCLPNGFGFVSVGGYSVQIILFFYAFLFYGYYLDKIVGYP